MSSVSCSNSMLQYIAAVVISLFIISASFKVDFDSKLGQNQDDISISISSPSSFAIFDDSIKSLGNCEVLFKNSRMRICHFIPYGNNFGDELGPIVIKKLLENKFGCSASLIPILNLAKMRRSKRDVCLFSLGSIFHFVKEGDHIWGTGINPTWSKSASYAKQRNLTFYSVRGPKSEAKVRDHGLLHTNNSIGHGDPGFLIPFLFPECRILNAKKHLSGAIISDHKSPRICFVPHAHDLQNKNNKLLPSENLLSVKQPWQEVVGAIKNCDYVASTSLHGIVVADSMGVPSLWIQFNDTRTIKTEGTFKYLDYFATTGQHDRVPYSNFTDIFHTSNYAKPLPLQDRISIAKRTVDSFPFHLFTTGTNTIGTFLPSQDQNKSTDKILVIMIGTLRGGELAWNSFYKNLLLPNAADLALLVPVGTPRNISSLFNYAKYVWTNKEYEDWGEAIDLIGGNGKWRNLVSNMSVIFGGTKEVDPNKGSSSIILMLRYFLSQNLVRENLINKYDRFVLTRSDHYYGCLHNLTLLDSKYLWVPFGEDYGGITDRHAVINKNHILKALNILPELILNPEKYIVKKIKISNPEKLIKIRWTEQGLWKSVKRFPRMMFTCATANDETRWRSKSKKKSSEGVYLKYLKEYEFTKLTCMRQQSNYSNDVCKNS